jgi:ribosome maturation factor RimP
LDANSQHPLGDTILRLARDAIERAGFDVIRLQMDGRRNIRIWVDRDPGGVNVSDCTTLNRVARAALDADGLDSGGFQFEVMSPGIDRLLCRDKDFVRFAGQEISVRLKVKRGDRRAFKGKLVGFEHGVVKIDGPEGPFSFDLAREVEEVRLAPTLAFPTEGQLAERRASSGRHKKRRKH